VSRLSVFPVLRQSQNYTGGPEEKPLNSDTRHSGLNYDRQADIKTLLLLVEFRRSKFN
jgi:hypothetical protein